MKYFILFLSFLFAGCSLKNPPLDTVKSVDIQRYLGTWYEIARYENSFEKGCSDISATYSLKDNGDIKVLNRCTKADGVKNEAIGVAYATDTSNAKLKVSFFRPFYGNYWILMLDEEYSYVVIGEPSRKYFWILARTQTLDQEILDKITSKMPEFGYKKELLVWRQ